jgi:hypothetical protein
MKTGIELIFTIFFEELLHAAMWLNCPRVEGHGAKKEVCFAHKILAFYFFLLFFLLMVLHDVTFDVTTTI